METAKKANSLSIKQQQYVNFLAAGRVDRTGKKWSKGEYAQVLGVHPTTLSDWQHVPGFKEALFEASIARIAEFVPDMLRAQVAKAISSKDTNAFMAVMRQAGLLKADKSDNKNENYTEVKLVFNDGS